MNISRRHLLAAAAATPLAAQNSSPDRLKIAFHHLDQGVERMMAIQNLDAKSRYHGGFPDESELYPTGSANGFLSSAIVAALSPESKFHRSGELMSRMRLAQEFVFRTLTPDGNLNLLITNFNSPPDTAFSVHGLASATIIAKRRNENELFAISAPLLKRMGASLIHGGIHTPNHRWAVSEALAQLYEIFGDSAYVNRIDQWLAEGIDIDEDGQFDERSTTVYNTVCDKAFTVMAAKLNRPELLDPVRKNLNAMLYLMHPNGEVVTEISHRQDLNTRGTMARYWLPLQYLAIHEGNGQFGTVAESLFENSASVLWLLEYPELQQKPKTAPLPDDYVKEFPASGCARIRHKDWSATILSGTDRFFTVRKGDAIVEAVRFATSFFGKGQFRGTSLTKEDGAWTMSQSLVGPYYQPLDPPRHIKAGEFGPSHRDRKQSEICRLTQSVSVQELANGFRLRIQAKGTPDVPLAVEIGVRDGVGIRGTQKDILASGMAELKAGGSTLRIGPGHKEHSYVQLRGALPKLPGPGFYITGLTPFDRTIDFLA